MALAKDKMYKNSQLEKYMQSELSEKSASAQ